MDSGKWFANRGQILQTTAAVLGCAFAGVKSWPDIGNTDLVSAWLIVFVIFLVLVATQLRQAISVARAGRAGVAPGLPLPVTTAQYPAPPPEVKVRFERSCTAIVKTFVISLPLGSFAVLPGANIRVEFRELRTHPDRHGREGAYAPVLGVDSGGGVFYGGERTTQVAVNLYCVPVPSMAFGADAYSIYCHHISEDVLYVMTLVPEHVNPHSAVVTLRASVIAQQA